jgi:aldehyde dehydrogenase (NAD(P)+)
VLSVPFKMMPIPPWMAGHKNLRALGEKLTRFEAAPSMLKLPGVAAAALKG